MAGNQGFNVRNAPIMTRTLTLLVAALALRASGHHMSAAGAKARPNIVWIFVDDMSANFGCYGEKTIKTPIVDQFAADGTRFSNAYVTAPVCSPCRSALITGMYQTTIGAHHHRSGRGKEKIHLPQGVVPVPVLFQKAGYFTTITKWPINERNAKARGKTDYNFEWDAKMYDHGDWRARAKGQPFFTQAHEELYDLKADPFELNNLAGDPAHRDTLLTLRARLDDWMKKTDDKGRVPESDAMYDSDMAVYVRGRGGDGSGNSETERNIKLMKKWAVERPMKVNP